MWKTNCALLYSKSMSDTYLPELAEEMRSVKERSYAECVIALTGTTPAPNNLKFKVPLWKTKPEGKFKLLNFVPVYKADSLEMVGWTEDWYFGITLESWWEEGIDSEELNDYYDSVFGKEDEEFHTLPGDHIAKLKSLAGFGYILEDTPDTGDGHIDGPASIAVWKWLASFASPQNRCITFENRNAKAVGIAWITFSVLPPDDLYDDLAIEKFLADDARKRAEALDVKYEGCLQGQMLYRHPR